ncbi:heavy-metal-associated domain-containing protein [Nafulsella turpanensis]|uniref:heavy-metal-associated domain-containing protein n=1 Tax=Nafulsella turpanensis TaxID=1265690 RepID=UPI001F1D8438|nr:heavy-metal-associated domain-containing protein [Nafulsella turpanensis]
MMKIGILAGTMALAVFAFTPASAEKAANASMEFSQTVATTTFQVSGKCGMCKNRIESAVKELKGIEAANWDVETKALTVKYDATKVKEADIHQKVADAGHDTQEAKATDEVYNSLPGCCKYEREG